MWLPFVILLMLNGAIGVVVWLAMRKVFAHMRANPEAAKLISEHVIAPLLTGEEPKADVEPVKPEVKKSKGTFV